MKQDPTSVEFVNQRVKEILEECINNDKEALLDKISHQYSYLKSEYSKLENENNRLSNQLRDNMTEFNRKSDELHEQL